ncbi:MAG: aspartyl protease family protein [Deltaproteobacteria bacterium]|nr:aspartyl protease family protein [Deltaproteobacteria bacterium]
MGIFYVDGTIIHAKRQRKLRFLVDTGAFFTVVPRDVLSALQVSPMREETVQFADGRKARWKVGEVRLAIDGRSVTTLVLFGKKGTQPLLGAYSLEGLGLSVDSRHRRLVPMPVVIVASLVTISEGTSEIQKLVLARNLLQKYKI